MILVVSGITFALLSNAGGDALSNLRENPQISAVTIEKLHRLYGLDQPVAVRYAKWLSGVVRGELGDSLFYRVPVGSLVWSRLLNTVLLGAIALLISVSVAVTLSILSVRIRSPLLNYCIEFLVFVTASTPRIVLALVSLAFIVWASSSIFAIQSGSFASVLISAFVLASPLIALFLSQAHRELTIAMDEDFVHLARAKGLSELAVITRHASRAAFNPLLTVFGLSLGSLVGGSVIVETILGWPGIGALMVTAVRGRDVPLVMGIVVVASFAVWLGNAIAEFLQAVNDKRLRLTDDISRN